MGYEYEVIVIGGGQAGLAIGYFLKQRKETFLLLDVNWRTGDSWRNRYDSLQLFTPRKFSGLPGWAFPGDPDGLPTKDETADYLEAYANRFELLVAYGTAVTRVERTTLGFRLQTTRGEYTARRVIVATGPFQTPAVPSFADGLDESVYQVHSFDYRNPAQLNEGRVLVVGCGNSGAQIAVELAKEREVTLAVSTPPAFKPMAVAGKSIFWYFDKLGLLQADKDSLRGSWLKHQPEQIYGFELKKLMADGRVAAKPRAAAADGRRVVFGDGSAAEVDNVIWATGFRPDYSWLAIPEALDERGAPLHNRGVSPVPGLYYLGLPWQTCRGSALLGWVGQDAEALVKGLDGRAAQAG
ncbi:oxidoreductase [Paenibacillus sp. J31TS4]|uniref:flavin-containing monooxygenase n=1 Tax=Paenibacillus sp. J31TS4 TaxID=2807195 RepID=UPI001B043572|nr:NAD(P)-binding domain-containing protein [Paenibacillus sp. J31TS4]GIP37024.1 oxidoreductase [Paenibacillus sp. J31TS4]